MENNIENLEKMKKEIAEKIENFSKNNTGNWAIIEETTNEEYLKSYEEFKKRNFLLLKQEQEKSGIAAYKLQTEIKKYIKINIEDLVITEGLYTVNGQFYRPDAEERIKAKKEGKEAQAQFAVSDPVKPIELNIFNPFMNINTNYDVFISSLSEYSEDEGKNMVYNDLKNNEGKKINVFKDFIDFSEKFLLDFVNNQRFTNFTGGEIKKNGFVIQIIPFNNDEMKEDNYTLKGEKNISGNKIKYKLTADDLISENSTILTEKSKEKLKESLKNE